MEGIIFAKTLQLQKIIISLGCAAPLIGSYYIVPRNTLPFDFYDNYFIFILIHLFHLSTPQKSYNILPNWLLKGFSLFLLITLLSLINNPSALGFPFIKQFFGGIFSASAYFIVFKLADFKVLYLFNRYVYFAFFASILAIAEEAFHLGGIHLKTAFPSTFGLYRVGGLSGEPYNLSLALFPAVFFYLLNSFSTTKQIHESRRTSTIKFGAIALAFLLTFSSTGYIGLFLALIVVAFHKGYLNPTKPKFFIAPLFFSLVYFVFSQLLASDRYFESKVDDGLWFLQTEIDDVRQLDRLNSSSFALFSNYQITVEGFKDNPLFGVGLGNYEILFHEKFDEHFGQYFKIRYGKSNFNDANSMFLRLVAETGIIGIAIFLFFLFKHLIKRKIRLSTNEFYLLAINHGIFILILIRLIRCGNYLSDGMFFFILLFFYSDFLFHSRKNQIGNQQYRNKNYLNEAAIRRLSESEKTIAPL